MVRPESKLYEEGSPELTATKIGTNPTEYGTEEQECPRLKPDGAAAKANSRFRNFTQCHAAAV